MNSKYDNYSDEELIEMYNEGDAEIADYLLSKHKKIVGMISSKMTVLSLDPDDVIQEGMIGLYKAIVNYKPDKNAKFTTFANLCVTRNILTGIYKSGNKKNIPLQNYISLFETTTDSEGNTGLSIEEVHPSDEADPERIALNNEKYKELTDYIEENLTDLEKKVVDLRVAETDVSEIPAILGISDKSADNAYQRAKKKISAFLLVRD